MTPTLLKDEVAVVTGGTAGIGRAIATAFASAGATVIVLGTKEIKGAETIAEIEKVKTGKSAKYLQTDVASAGAVDQAVKEIYAEHGRIDILVNNAGIVRDQLLMKMSEEEWDAVLDVNLKSCFLTCRAVVRGMMKARKGKIINIGSVVGIGGNPGQANYSASKAGMIGFTKSLAKELASRQICVNCVAPGYICTPMTEGLSESQKDQILSQIPLGRFGKPEDVAHMALYLASPLAQYITGQVISVSGGILI